MVGYFIPTCELLKILSNCSNQSLIHEYENEKELRQQINKDSLYIKIRTHSAKIQLISILFRFTTNFITNRSSKDTKIVNKVTIQLKINLLPPPRSTSQYYFHHIDN